MKALGQALDADPSAIYRHVEDKDELLRAVGDRLLDGVVDGLPGDRSWDEVVRTTCRRLRAALLAQPELAALARDAPTRQPNELRLTETLLAALARRRVRPGRRRGRLPRADRGDRGRGDHRRGRRRAAAADRRATYAAWRRAYRGLPRDRYPASRAAAPFLYRGTADQRFALTVDALLRRPAGYRGRTMTTPAFLHPFARPARPADQYVTMVGGAGAEVWDRDGRRYIDGMASLWYCNAGYGRGRDRRRRARADGGPRRLLLLRALHQRARRRAGRAHRHDRRRCPTAGCSSRAAGRRRWTRPSSSPASRRSGPATPSAR